MPPRPTARPTARTALVTAVAALAGIAGGVPLAAPASAAPSSEVAVRPADGVFTVEGHGWGHGRGMSQWGAEGAATLGLSADQITATYYPGTARTVLPDAPVRVLLSADEGADTDVAAAPGLTVTDLSGGAVQPLEGASRFRARVDPYGLHVEALGSTGWTPVAVGGTTASPGPYAFTSASGQVRLRLPDGSQRDYRGALRAVRDGAAVRSVAVLGMEDYLLGVVPRESSPSWLPAALQAQAIAARSYTANKRSRTAAASWDICDTTACQVFGGTRLVSASGAVTELEPASTTAAVRASAGVVRSLGGVPVLAEFSASNGGWSTAGTVSYLAAQRDDWDGVVPNVSHSWTGTIRAPDLEARFPAVGHLERLRVTRRDGNGEWGGRVQQVVLEGTSASGAPTSVTTDGAGVQAASSWPAHADGTRSVWWHVRSVPTPQELQVVRAMYVDFLGRPADDGGLHAWAGLLADGSQSSREVALQLARSREYTGRLVGRLYGEVLGRAPDAGGRDAWAALLQADPARVSDIAAGLYASDEMYADNGRDDRRWVGALYRQVLHREADAPGLDAWTAQVRTRGRAAVAHDVYDSPEDLARRVQLLYGALLGRGADPTGLAGWPAVVRAQGDIALASFLASSDEYAARAATRS